MNYRSDWPEIGLSSAMSEGTQAQAGNLPDWMDESRVGETVVRWVAFKDRFESKLYGFPIWNLRLEVENLEDDILDARAIWPQRAICEAIERFVTTPPWGAAYVFSRIIKTEPLYEPFLKCGFLEVEQRRLYRTRVEEIKAREPLSLDESIQFLSLAEAPPAQCSSFREQMFDVCADAFGDRGYSRHFSDPFLLERLAGRAYILAAMELNFERLDAGSFLLAVDRDSARVCGFSVVGKKAGLSFNMYTQLLSAVRKEYQGRDIYLGLTRLLVQKLPEEAMLLNATHTGNIAIQVACQRSGRIHLADTIVMRRVLK